MYHKGSSTERINWRNTQLLSNWCAILFFQCLVQSLNQLFNSNILNAARIWGLPYDLVFIKVRRLTLETLVNYCNVSKCWFVCVQFIFYWIQLNCCTSTVTVVGFNKELITRCSHWHSCDRSLLPSWRPFNINTFTQRRCPACRATDRDILLLVQN